MKGRREKRRRPQAGSIEERLRTMYPRHRGLHRAVADLSRASLVALSDLADVRSAVLEALLPKLFLVALRDKLADLVPQIVALDVTPDDMVPSFTEKWVTLLEENGIPQLEAAYNPMYEDEEVDLVSEEPLEVEEEEVDVEEKEVEVEDDERTNEEDTTCSISEIQVEPCKELITMKMYETVKGGAFLEALWGVNHDKLLERSNYRELQERIEKLWERGATALMLTGTPGIGKTGFLLFMLMKLLGAHKPVLFKTKSGKSYFFEPPYERTPDTSGTPPGYKCFEMCNDALLMDRAVYFLADGKLPDPPPFTGKALLASTPLKENSKEYKKDSRHDCVLLPVWSAAEIALAWQEIFDPTLIQEATEIEDSVASNGVGDLDEDEMQEEDAGNDEEQVVLAGEQSPEDVPEKQGQDVSSNERMRARAGLTLDAVKQRYRQWGGTPRYVLERPDEDMSNTVVMLKSIQTTVEAAGKEIADADHPSHKLTHMKVKPGYQHYGYMFASPYVTDLARQKLKAETSLNLRAFLSFEGLQAHALNGLKGNIFQAEFMHVASGRKTMRVRQVFQDIKKHSQDRPKVFEFNKVFQGLFCLEEVPAAALPVNRIIWPGSKIQAAFDAMKIVQRKGRDDILELYQVMLSSKRNAHGLKYEAVDSVMKRVGVPESRTRVYIACTSELYPNAGYQKWLEAGGRVLQDKAQLQRLANIAQYALDSGI